MSNNIQVTAGSGTTLKTTDNAGVHTPHHNVDTLTTITNVVHVDDNASTLSIDDGGGSITVDNGGTFAVQVSSLPSQAYKSSVTLTRTADTNAYAANDILGAATGSTAALTFASIGPSAGIIQITSVSLEIDASAIISGETSYLLHLYDATPPSALGDNAAFDLPSGDRGNYLGFISLGAPADLGSTLWAEINGVGKVLKLASASTSLFGYLVTVGAYTPTSARVYKINLHTVAL